MLVVKKEVDMLAERCFSRCIKPSGIRVWGCLQKIKKPKIKPFDFLLKKK